MVKFKLFSVSDRGKGRGMQCAVHSLVLIDVILLSLVVGGSNPVAWGGCEIFF
jgi:hypothetical protein